MPPEIKQYLDQDETVIFSVKSKRLITKSTALFGLFFSLIWLGITFTVGYGMLFEPLMTALSGGSSTLIRNHVPVTIGLNNLTDLLFPTAIIGLFSVIGIGAPAATIYSFFSSGGWFVGTNKRFLNLRKNTLRSINWSEFSGNLTTSGSPDNGDLIIELNSTLEVYSGNMGRRRSSARESISIVGVQNVYEIERLCREKIEEFKNKVS